MRLRAILPAVVAALLLTACGSQDVPSMAPSSEWVTDAKIGQCVRLTDHGIDALLGDERQPSGEWFAARWSSTDPKQLIVGGRVAGDRELALFTVWDASADLSPTEYELELAKPLPPGQPAAIYRNGAAAIQACMGETAR